MIKILKACFLFFIFLFWSTTSVKAGTLQTLINNTASGGTVAVPSNGGNYTEDISISKPVYLDCHGCTVNGKVEVTANNVTIKNITMNQPVQFGLLNQGNSNTYENIKVLHTKLSTRCKKDWENNLSNNTCGDDMDGIRIAGDTVTLKNITIDLSGTTDLGPAHPDCVQFATWNKRASNITIDGLYCDNLYDAGDTSTGSNGFQLATEDYGWENITIKNSFLHTKTCILAYNGQSGLTFEHNTCVSSGTAGSTGFYSASNSNDYFNNNILLNHKDIVNVPGKLTGSSNNIIYCISGPCNYDSSFSKTGQLWDRDPMLDLTNYHPKNGSPACLSGGAYIGAYPCGGSVSPSPTPLTKKGDVNRDGRVDILDIGIIIDNYNKNPMSDPRADVNNDGVCSILDIGLAIDNYGK